MRNLISTLAVITYEMLTGKLPCIKSRDSFDIKRRCCEPITRHRVDIPVWIKGAIMRALSVDPVKRQGDIPEFIYDLTHPSPRYINTGSALLLERNPAGFWRWIAFILLIMNLVLLVFVIL
ncbi:MAG: hypothetical protein BMS9Abin15_0617 [Gammaproteobacteria bacterium]|nr:MAG: hypothetical protein BMS9Abin15_0617 [Gammaproteobacteria bacterium]